MPAPFRVLIADYKNVESSTELPYLFKQADCTVDVYCSKGSWLRKNRYTTIWHQADTEHPEVYAEGLLALAREQTYDWIVLADESSLRVMNDAAFASDLLPLSKIENRTLLGSKAALSLFCKQYEIPTPRFAVSTDGSDLDIASKDLAFPLLVKVDRSSAGKGVFLCRNESELVDTVAVLTEKSRKDLILQEYIVGENIAVEALYQNGSLRAYASSKVVETIGSEFGVSSVRHYMAMPGIEPLLSDIGAKVGIHGFCSMTLMQSRDGYYLVEADIRPNAWLTHARFAGVDFADALRTFLIPGNNQATLSIPPDLGIIEMRHFFRDMNQCLTKRNLRGLWDWCCNKDGRWRFVPVHDRHTLFATLGMLVSRRFDSLRSCLRPLKHLLHVRKV